MRNLIQAILLFFMPSNIGAAMLRICGHKIGKNFKVGFSFLNVKEIIAADNCRIGHFNFIFVNRLQMKQGSYIGAMNVIKGPIEVVLDERGAIGKSNLINRGKIGITYGVSVLSIGKLSKITAFHYIDLSRSIFFGDYSTLAGVRSQIWTHGYMHAAEGPERFRVDGEVNIGNNVYIGSGSIINPGITIADAINVGGNSSVAKSLLEPGMYVAQPLRYIPKSYEETKSKLKKVVAQGLVEDVYEK